MLDVYTGVFGSPNDDVSARDERVTSVAEELLRAYIGTVQWGFAAHCMRATCSSAPLHLRVVDVLPEDPKATSRGPPRLQAVFHGGSSGASGVFQGDFGVSEMITAMNKMMDTVAEQSKALHADSLTSQAATVAMGAWR